MFLIVFVQITEFVGDKKGKFLTNVKKSFQNS